MGTSDRRGRANRKYRGEGGYKSAWIHGPWGWGEVDETVGDAALLDAVVVGEPGILAWRSSMGSGRAPCPP